MKKVFLFFLLCAFFVTPPLFARHFFNEEQELRTKKIVIELSLKNQGNIPPFHSILERKPEKMFGNFKGRPLNYNGRFFGRPFL